MNLRAIILYDLSGGEKVGRIRIPHASFANVKGALWQANNAGGRYLQVSLIDPLTGREVFKARSRQRPTLPLRLT
jgi:uncharacterized protein (DUF736 family)